MTRGDGRGHCTGLHLPLNVHREVCPAQRSSYRVGKLLLLLRDVVPTEGKTQRMHRILSRACPNQDSDESAYTDDSNSQRDKPEWHPQDKPPGVTLRPYTGIT
ncbi:hypothetical protein NKDENANG_01066 [Candidatus Entotheonellaceae bacterium PAL068K]